MTGSNKGIIVDRRTWIHVMVILLTGIVFCSWSLSPSNFFQFDDFKWQWKTQVASYLGLFNVIPNAPFNDRPVGAVLIKGLFSLFGVNAVAHHMVLLLIHLGNSLLLYWVLSIILHDFLKKTSQQSLKELPWVAAILFAGWSSSTLRAVYWDSAIFDLLAGFFALIASCFYFMAQNGKGRIWKSLLCILAYGLALRSKEMSVLLPCMLAVITVWQITWNQRVLRSQITWNLPLLMGLIIMMIAYVARILWVKSNYPGLMEPSHPYFLTHDPLILARNFIRYLAIYFDPFQDDYIAANGGWSLPFYGLGSVLCLGFLWYAGRKYQQDRNPLILIPCLLVLQMAPVLQIQNMQTRLYLYIPSMILSVLTGAIICQIVGQYKRVGEDLRIVMLLLASFTILAAVSLNGSNPKYRNFYLSVGRENKKLYGEIMKIPTPPHGATVYLEGEKREFVPYCLFSEGSGSGDVVRSYYNDPSLSVQIVSETKINTYNIEEPTIYFK